VAEGPIEPSSEALSHAACFSADSSIGAVIHAHHAGLWRALCAAGRAAAPEAEYGTPALAAELRRAFQAGPGRVIAAAGHFAGIFAADTTPAAAAQRLLAELETHVPSG